jgi:hypothetical protein
LTSGLPVALNAGAHTHHLDQRAGDLAAEGIGNEEDLLPTRDLARWLKVSTQWCEIGRHKGYGPPFVVLSPKRVRYRRGAVLRWLRSREHTCTDEYDARRTAGPGRPRKEVTA